MTARAAASGLWSPFGLYYGWVIVACAMVINATSSWMSPFTFAFFIGPMGEDLGWSRGEMSFALTFRLVTAGVAGPFLGRLTDHFGTRWIGAGAGLIAGISVLATSAVHELWALYLIFTISGVAGFGGPGGALLTNVPVGKWFVTKRGRAMALATIGFPIGVTLAVPIAQGIIDTAGWRTAWLVFGFAILVTVVPTCALFMRRLPEDHGLLPDGAVALPPLPAGKPPRAAATPDVSWTVGQTFRHPTAWILLMGTVLGGFGLFGTLVHRVAFWRDQGMSSTLVAFGTITDPLTVVFSAMAFGLLAERVPVRFLGLAGSLGFAASMLPMIFTTGQTYTIFLHNIVWGMSAGASISMNNLVWANYFGRGSLGAIQGVVLPVSVIVNGLSAPFYGYLFDLGINPRAVWAFSLSLFVITGLLYFFARPPQISMVSASETVVAPTLSS